jgi:hypothetical protein
MYKRKEGQKDLQHLMIHMGNELFQCIFFFEKLVLTCKVVKNAFVGRLFTKFLTCGYDKMEGISKESMPLTLVQNISFHNGLQNFPNNFVYYPCLWQRNVIL